ncbi:MAG: hypothetical protein ACREL5_03430 [Gemmatimonadales bacterium]
MQFRLIARAALVAIAVAGCSSGTNSTTTPPPPPPSPTGQLYVGIGDIPGSLLVYDLPLTSTSTPAVTVAHDNSGPLALNSTTLAVTRPTNYSVSFFTLPLTSASGPYATLVTGGVIYPVFEPSGAFYYSASNMIDVYTPPFSASSTPSSHIATPLLSAGPLSIGPSGDVYELAGNVIGVVHNGALVTKLTAEPGTEFDAAAATATQLFVCEGTNNLAAQVYVYPLPLTATETPSLIIHPNTDAPGACVLDSSGDLYIGSAGIVSVLTPPFTASSHAAVQVNVHGGIGGLAIGQ